MSSHALLDLISPICCEPSNVGSNILARQPDVEVAAILLKPFPLTGEKFKELAGGRDFMTMQFAVLEVGGPGFSSVPYGKKGEKPLNPLPLYTKKPDGSTLFHSFKKADSNLERGVRVDTQEQEDGEVLDVTCALAPGLTISTFLREDTLKGNVLFGGKLEGPDRAKPQELQYVKLAADSPLWASDVIPENTVVWVQVGVYNSDQAAKGSLLKIKKVMPAPNAAVMGPSIASLPASLQLFDETMDTYKTRFPSIARALYAGNNKLMACTPERAAYSNYDEAAGGFVLCDVGSGLSEVVIEKSLVTGAFGCSDVGVCQKMLDIAIATMSLDVLVRSSVNSDNMDMGSGGSPYRGVLLHLDTNKLLGLAEVKQHGVGDRPLSGFDLQIIDNTIAWSVKTNVLAEGRLVLVLDCEELKAKQPLKNSSPVEQYLSWGCEGRFRNLRLCLAPVLSEGRGLATEVEAMLAKQPSELKLVTTMQLRTQFAKARVVASKRKRATLAEEEEEEEVYEPATP